METQINEHEIGSAVSHYFVERAAVQRRELRELFRIGRRHFWVGLAVLIGCLTTSQLATSVVQVPTISRLIEESLIIVGWVANWKTIEIFLYDWWPFKRRIGLYERLARATVTIDVDPVPSRSARPT